MKTLLLSFIVYYSISTTGISGKITDKDTLEELAGVMIIVNKKDTTYTDLDGRFHFNNIDSIGVIDLKYPSYSSDDIVMTETINPNELLSKKN